MPDLGAVATLLFSNATADTISIWLEPWADELSLAPRSELALQVTMPAGRVAEWPEIESSEGLISVYAPGGCLMRATIDGVEQDTTSAINPSPDTGALSPRAFVEIVFGSLPEARPGGRPLPSQGTVSRTSWFGRLSRLFGRR